MTTRSFALVIVHQRRPSKERPSTHQRPSAQGDLLTTLTGAVLDQGFQHIVIAIHWIASLSEQPGEQYRRYAWKLLDLVETT